MPGATTTAKKRVVRLAVKQARQSLVRAARNQITRNEMKSLIKQFMVMVQSGNAEKAAKLFPKVVSAIDKGFKKNLIHRNNAARKKSLVQRALTKVQKEGGAPKVEKVKVEKPKAVKAAKKTAKKA